MFWPCDALLCEAVDEGLDHGLRHGAVRTCLADDTHAFDQTDQQAGGGRGFDAVRQLKDHEETRLIPVVAVTASALDQERTRIMAAGFNAYQRKPISVKELLRTVEELLLAHREAGA